MARWLETATGWSIRRLITTARRYRTITINIAGHTLTAADPLPPDLTQALHNIHHDTETLNEPTQEVSKRLLHWKDVLACVERGHQPWVVGATHHQSG